MFRFIYPSHWFYSLVILIGISVLVPGCKTSSSSTFPASVQKELRSVLETQREESGFAGLMLAVQGPDEETWMGATGEAIRAGSSGSSTSAQQAVPMNTAYHSRIGSITKTFTATLILLLHEQHELDLDDTVADWFGTGFYPGADNVTIRQLLNMTAGLVNYAGTDAFDLVYDADPFHAFTDMELVNFSRTSPSPMSFAPGAGWEYSNTNYILLGLIAEHATGKTYAQMIREHIFLPAGLTESYVPANGNNTIPAPCVHGYMDDTDMTAADPSIASFAGNIISTLPDMLRWAKVHGTGSLLSQASRDEMFTWVSVADGTPCSDMDFGYGAGTLNMKGAKGHNGSVPGYQSFFYTYKGYRFAALANTTGADIGAINTLFEETARVFFPEAVFH